MELKPNYRGKSIVNLMSSIGTGLGLKSNYNNLKILKSNEIKNAKNIVLIVIDGLGYNYLKNKGKNTLLCEKLIGKMSSVLPSTTASAITTFATGLAPQQHGLTGWHMLLKEFGIISTPLKFKPRACIEKFSSSGITMENIINVKSFVNKLKIPSYTIHGKQIVNTEYNQLIFNKSKRLAYNSLNEFFRKIKQAIKADNNHNKKYIFAYWPKLDSLEHRFGTKHKIIKDHLNEIDMKLKKFLKKIKNTDTLLIITADHGFMDTPLKKLIRLKNHPKLQECLSLPICGEGRFVYCYVHPSKTKQFENYVNKNLKHACKLYPSEELVKKEYFGIGKINKKFLDRIGDYILIMKEDYSMKEIFTNEKFHHHLGKHGGISEGELFVPLITIKT